MFQRFCGELGGKWLLGIACLVMWGCNAEREMETAPVTGKVSYNGKPVSSGTVMFVPSKGPAATGEIGKDGTYALQTYRDNDGAVLGTHKVMIISLAAGGGMPPPVIPEKYLRHDTSGLEVEVSSGPNQHDFILTDDADADNAPPITSQGEQPE